MAGTRTRATGAAAATKSATATPPSKATRSTRGRKGKATPGEDEDHSLAEMAANAAGQHKAGTPADGITDLERERQLLMQRNRERMMQLKLPDMASSVGVSEADKPAAKPTRRGIKTKRAASEEEPRELRRSRRALGMGADPNLSKGISHETRSGEIILNAEGFSVFAVGEPEREDRTPLHTIQDIPFASVHGEKESDEAFLHTLQALAGGVTQDPPNPEPVMNHSFELDSDRIRKVVSSAATVLGFAPLPDGHLFLAAGDKAGHIGLWDVDKKDNGEDDGVLHFKPHDQFVSGLAWRDHGNSLYTLSYDGTVRRLDTQTAVFELAHHSSENEYSSFDCCQSGNTAYLCDSSGDLRILDLRSGKAGSNVELHRKKINSVHLEPSGKPLLVTASTDTTVAVWDIRKTIDKKPLDSLPHGKSCHGAYWNPSGDGSLATVSFDDYVRLFDRSLSGKHVLSHRVRHNNNTGRWILPFKPQWSPAGDAVVVGGMQRTIDMISPELGAISQAISGEGLTAIPARNCFHPWRPVLCGATNSGRLHIFK